MEVWRDDVEPPERLEPDDLTAWALGQMDRRPMPPIAFFATLYTTALAMVHGWNNGTAGLPWAYHRILAVWLPVRLQMAGAVTPAAIVRKMLEAGGIIGPTEPAALPRPELVQSWKVDEPPPPAADVGRLQDPRAFERDGVKVWSLSHSLFFHPDAINAYEFTGPENERATFASFDGFVRDARLRALRSEVFALRVRVGEMWADAEIRWTKPPTPAQPAAPLEVEAPPLEVGALDVPGVELVGAGVEIEPEQEERGA